MRDIPVITLSPDGREYTIKGRLDAEGAPSATGKTVVLSSTGGPAAVGNGVKIAVNVFKAV